MATRLYLRTDLNVQTGSYPSGEQATATSSTSISVTDSATAFTLNSSAGTSQVSKTITLGATGAHNFFCGMFVSKGLAGSTVVGGSGITLLLADTESNTNVQLNVSALNIYLWDPVNGVKRGTVRDSSGTSLGTINNGTSELTSYATGITSTAVTATAGDVIIAEIWGNLNTTMTSYTASWQYGGTAVSTTENAAISSVAAYIEFTENITFLVDRTATSSVTQAGNTISATAANIVSNSLNITQAANTISATAANIVSSSLSKTEVGNTISATALGIVRTATLSRTQSPNTISATAANIASNSLSKTQAGNTISANLITKNWYATLSNTQEANSISAEISIVRNISLNKTQANNTIVTGLSSRTTIEKFDSEIRSLSPSAIIEMFILDLTNTKDTLGVYGSLYRFHPGTNKVSTQLVWQGNIYFPYPIEASGFELNSQGTIPRPTIRVANIFGDMTSLNRQYDDLVGAKVTRKRTFAKYLDSVNFPLGNYFADPNVEFAEEIYYIDRKVTENPIFAEYELAASWDISNVQLPRRQVIQNVCYWKYRSGECGYAGGAVADEYDNPTTVLANDKCSKKLTGCVLRFPGNNAILPFGGFPAAGLIK